MATSRRRSAIAAGVAVAALGLAGCADAGAAPTPSSAPPEASLAALEHVHEVAFSGEDLLIASHQGVYAVDLESGALDLVGGTRFDAMGMAVTDAGVLASGHPGAQVDDVFVAPNVGLIGLDGEEWASISLSGEVDFHALTASADGAAVAGLPSGETAVLASGDGGATWQRGAQLEARDLVFTDDGGLVATTADGLMRSTDGGATFAAVEDAPLLVLIAADADGFVGVDAEGAVVRSGTDGWQTLGATEGAAAAIAVADGMLAVVDDRGLVISRDDGDTWEVLVP